jgi:Trehalase
MSHVQPIFSVGEIPFSRRGAWTSLSPVIGLHQVSDAVHLVSHQQGIIPVLAFVPTSRRSQIVAEIMASPGLELGVDEAEQGVWRNEAGSLAAALLDHLWDGEQFVARGTVDGQASRASSLLNLLPLVIADRLPSDVSSRLAARLRMHLTDFGPATEPPTSELYEPDGYWRGPIWAPSTVLIEYGLRRGGHVELADTISTRFLALCERSALPRTSTPSPVPACATAPTHGPPAATCSSPPTE